MAGVVKTLEQAVDEAASLPEADQEQIGQQLLAHIERLRQLRDEIDKGLRSLDAGKGHPMDVDAFLAAQRQGRR